MNHRTGILVSKTLYQVGILTLISSIVWTVSGVFQAINKAPEKVEVEKKILTPVNPSFDFDTLDMVLKREQIDLSFADETTNLPINSSEIASTSATIDVSKN